MYLKLLPLFGFLFLPKVLFAQCGLTEVASPQTFGNNTNLGVISWQNTSNIEASDNSLSSVSALILGSNSHFLIASNFNFNLPLTSIICGVEVRMEKRAFGLFHSVNDESVRLMVGGVFSGTDKAGAGVWPGGDTYFTHGGSTDTWGNALTVADVNAANFGVGIQVNLSGLAVLPSAFIDHIEITIHYASTLPIELTSLRATSSQKNSALIEWSTHSETNNKEFVIEASNKGEVWNEIGRTPGAGSSSIMLDYRFTDYTALNTNYYRLKQIDFDGTASIAGTVRLNKVEVQESIVYPNPFKKNLIVEAKHGVTNMEVYSMSGELLLKRSIDEVSNLNMESFEPGIYLLKLIHENGELETIRVQKSN